MGQRHEASMPLAEEVEKGIPNKWLAASTAALGAFMVTTDNNIINIALPTLTQEFGTSAETVVWVAMSYALTTAGLMITLGRIADMVGRSRSYTFGSLIYTLALVLCASSQSLAQLIAFRALQGFGAAIIYANQLAIITAAFPARERGKGLGIIGAAVGLSLITGPALGGFLIDTLGWRSIFYYAVPMGVVSTVMAWTILRDEAPGLAHQRFDYWGATMLILLLVCLTLAINQGRIQGWSSFFALSLSTAVGALLPLFVVVETRAAYPVVDLALFRNRLFATANLSALFQHVAARVVTFLMPFYLIQALGYSPSKAGLLLTIGALAWFLAPISGWLSDKMGSRLLCTTGLGLQALSFFLLSGLDAGATLIDIIPPLGIMGLGAGLFQAPNQSAVMGSVPKERLGIASAMIGTIRHFGMASGLAIGAAIFTSRQLFYASQLGQLSEEGLAINAFLGGFHDTLLVAAFICIFAMLLSLVRGRPHPPSEN